MNVTILTIDQALWTHRQKSHGGASIMVSSEADLSLSNLGLYVSRHSLQRQIAKQGSAGG